MVLESRGPDGPPVRHRLEPSRRAVIGRGDAADIRVDDDLYVSRRHAEIWIEDGVVSVARLADAGSPVFALGAEVGQEPVEPGGHFVIGRTSFVLLPDEGTGLPQEDRQPTMRETLPSADDLSLDAGGDRLRLLDLLALPEILASRSPPEFFLHLAGLLRMATGARESCVIDADGTVLARDTAATGDAPVVVSRAHTEEALAAAPRPVFYSWATEPSVNGPDSVDWAICAALKGAGEAPVLFHVAGRAGAGQAAAATLKEKGRFVGLVADMVDRTLSVRRLEVVHDRMQRFFAKPVVAKLASVAGRAELEPRLAQSTIMFFDLRGFSRKTEGRNEKILAHSGELRKIMTAMTEEVFREDGVVLQYLGDGLLACWNVPIADPAHVDRACRAALRMSTVLATMEGGWACGIGLHTGEVVAGSLGSDQLFAYTVLGDVVNRTSRVEGITKIVEVPILVTREVADRVSGHVASAVRLGRYLPVGMDVAMDLFELLPPATGAAATAAVDRAGMFGRGLALFEQGDWDGAYAELGRLGPGDRPARYLMSLAESHRRHPPKSWSGVIELQQK